MNGLRACGPNAATRASPGERFMLDVITLAIGLGFFALSIIYGLACDRL
jgi:CelD/BcsL family acetyltransferase involved in cellulose biosynthesis